MSYLFFCIWRLLPLLFESTCQVTVTAPASIDEQMSGYTVNYRDGEITVYGDNIRSIQVYDLNGHLLGKGVSGETIPAMHWGKGVYLVEVLQNNQLRMHKVVAY